MNIIHKFSPITVVTLGATFNLVAATSMAMAEPLLNNTVSKTTLSPEVRQALDSVYLAAKDANMVNPAIDNSKGQSLISELNGTNKAIKSSRDPMMQMVAVGLGVAAAMVVMNYFSGGTTTSGSFSGFSSAMFGGMLGDYAYRKYYAPPLPSVPAGIAQRVAP